MSLNFGTLFYGVKILCIKIQEKYNRLRIRDMLEKYKESLVSVIVPIYKTEPYLDRCIESIINQTYKNIEILLIDDGSPDGCPKICDEWEKKDNRIKVVHKINGGISSTRNIGLDMCKGEYITFIDSDDYIEPETVADLYFACLQNNSQMSICGRFIVCENYMKVDKCFEKTETIEPCDCVKYMLAGEKCDCVVWGKLYHRSLWAEIRFPLGKIYEDIAILYKVVLNANQITVLSKPLYNFYRHEGSITKSEFNGKQLDYTSNTREMLGDIRINYPELYEYACFSHITAIQEVLYKIATSHKEMYRKYREEFRVLSRELFSYRRVWLKSALFTCKNKIRCMFFLISCLVRPTLMFLKRTR